MTPSLAAWLKINSHFSLTEDNDPFFDLKPASIWKFLETDLTLLSLPPLFVVKDLLQILQHHKNTHLVDIGSFHEDLLHNYRNRFIYYLIYKDRSIDELSKIFISKGRKERKYFIPFIIREAARTIMKIYAFPFKEGIGQNNEKQIEQEIIEGLKNFITVFGQQESLFSKNQIEFFAYVRREEDIPLIREYQKAKNLLKQMSPFLAHKTRSSQSLEVEVEKKRSLSMGGISGILCNGAIEKITSIVPSELAMMEMDRKMDLFDIHLLENRLLIFGRDQYMVIRQYREFHVVFQNPESLDVKPQVIDFRWQYLFMTVLGDIISFYRDYFKVHKFFFYFPKNVSRTADTGQLLDIIHSRDFPDVRFFFRSTEDLEEILAEDCYNQSMVLFTQFIDYTPGQITIGKNKVDIPDNMVFTAVQYGKEKGKGKETKEEKRNKDKVSLEFRYGSMVKSMPFTFEILDSEVIAPSDTAKVKTEKNKQRIERLRPQINQMRDTMFLCISGAI